MGYIAATLFFVGAIIGVGGGVWHERQMTAAQPSYEYIIEGGQLNHISVQPCDGHNRPVEIIETADGSSAFYICGRKVER